MKIAIISDTHFGDSDCVLSKPGSLYFTKLLSELTSHNNGEQYKYLVILGDSLDLAVSNYTDVIAAAAPFFTAIKDLFEKIIIIPGNHDHDLWTMVQFQSQIAAQSPPKTNQWTASAFLHNNGGNITLQPSPAPGMSFHEGTFLDTLFPGKFVVAAPNIYLIDDDKTILMTHGQYFEFAWAFLSDWIARAFGKDLNKIPLNSLQHILGDNFLTNQIICSGLGQSEVNLTMIIQELEHDFKAKNYAPIVKCIIRFILSYTKGKNLSKEILEHKQEIMTFIRSVFSAILFTTRDHNDLDMLENSLKKEITTLFLPKLSFLKNTRARSITSGIWDRLEISDAVKYHKSLIHSDTNDEKNAERIKTYIDASNVDFSVKPLKYMIFGHTHHPVPWNNGATSGINPSPPDTKQIANCGGWLYKNGTTTMCGANIFIYDSVTKAISEIPIT